MKFGIEDSRNEFKETLNDKLEREVVGFLNSNGGNIYLGISDDGEVIGIKDNIDDVQLKIKDKIKNNILPNTLGLFDINVLNIEDKYVIHIVVAIGNQKPYYLKSRGMVPSGTFIRVGSGLEQLTLEQIQNYMLKRQKLSLKNIPSPNQELSFSQLKIFYEEMGFTINENFLKQLDFYMEDGRFNYLAYLMADNNHITIKVATYSGTDSYDLIENEEYGFCSLIKATKRVIDKFEMINNTYSKITSTRRKEIKKLDGVAIREAIVNAFVHNLWERENPPKFEIFSDHVSITSTGGLPEGINQEEFLKGYSFPRYPELMRIFKDMELVEQLGTGINRILKSYDKDVYEFSQNFIRVSFKYNSSKLLDKYDDKGKYIMTDLEKEIVEYIKKDNNITIDDLALKINKSKPTINRAIKNLKDNKCIERDGTKKEGYWKII